MSTMDQSTHSLSFPSPAHVSVMGASGADPSCVLGQEACLAGLPEAAVSTSKSMDRSVVAGFAATEEPESFRRMRDAQARRAENRRLRVRCESEDLCGLSGRRGSCSAMALWHKTAISPAPPCSCLEASWLGFTWCALACLESASDSTASDRDRCCC